MDSLTLFVNLFGISSGAYIFIAYIRSLLLPKLEIVFLYRMWFRSIWNVQNSRNWKLKDCSELSLSKVIFVHFMSNRYTTSCFHEYSGVCVCACELYRALCEYSNTVILVMLNKCTMKDLFIHFNCTFRFKFHFYISLLIFFVMTQSLKMSSAGFHFQSYDCIWFDYDFLKLILLFS